MFRLIVCTAPVGASGSRLKTVAPFSSKRGSQLPVTKSLALVAVSLSDERILKGEFMRIIFLAPLILAACAQHHRENEGFQAVYLSGKAAAEFHALERCALYENLTHNTLIPALSVPGWDEPRTVKDEQGKIVLKVSPC